ncbi:PIN domain-containing protein [candidate division KSB1 bacterium]|nr:MAG: PIN domain-containing protein [candidate division KSB1 bacterium]MBC6949277.1 PIN domain-containing protein [candidate division KSB1 bacterium]MCE7945102.1 PIN domain-containing protein [Chlorobi bacterium CHB1]MDL1874244.1 PIN domain-containing protein [Cytophagia bacterium CHB2]
MILTDTGPLVALLDKDDSHHAACVEASKHLPAAPLVTTWPCFTEAMYLLGEVGGYRYEAEFWKLLRDQKLFLLDLTQAEIVRANDLMEKYQNVPMVLADASLMAIAEHREYQQLFTIDSDFRVYRLPDGTALEIVPFS